MVDINDIDLRTELKAQENIDITLQLIGYILRELKTSVDYSIDALALRRGWESATGANSDFSREAFLVKFREDQLDPRG